MTVERIAVLTYRRIAQKNQLITNINSLIFAFVSIKLIVLRGRIVFICIAHAEVREKS